MPRTGTLFELFELFGTLNLNNPRVRRDIYIDSADNYETEIALFVLCTWDYFTNGANANKLAGLERVFMEFDSPLEVNLRGGERRQALSLMRTSDRHARARPIVGSRVTGVRAGGREQSGRTMVALSIAYTSMRQNGMALETWAERVASGAYGKRLLLGRRVPPECTKSVAHLSPYWTDAEIRKLIGA